MHNPSATSKKETQKIPLPSTDFSWVTPKDSGLMTLFNATNAGGGRGGPSRPKLIRSGSPGYDGTTDPGPPGPPV